MGQDDCCVSRTTTHSPHINTELETRHKPSLCPRQNTPCRACGPDGGLGDRDSQLSPPTDTPMARVFTPRMGVAVDREVLRPARPRPDVVDPDADVVEPLPGERRAGVAGVTHEVPPKRLTGRSRGPAGSRQRMTHTQQATVHTRAPCTCESHTLNLVHGSKHSDRWSMVSTFAVPIPGLGSP